MYISEDWNQSGQFVGGGLGRIVVSLCMSFPIISLRNRHQLHSPGSRTPANVPGGYISYPLSDFILCAPCKEAPNVFIVCEMNCAVNIEKIITILQYCCKEQKRLSVLQLSIQRSTSECLLWCAFD